jgi:hypothetical protein
MQETNATQRDDALSVRQQYQQYQQRLFEQKQQCLDIWSAPERELTQSQVDLLKRSREMYLASDARACCLCSSQLKFSIIEY